MAFSKCKAYHHLCMTQSECTNQKEMQKGLYFQDGSSIIASYLSNRSLQIRYLKVTSTSRKMPGGTSAGPILGLNFFLVLFNKAGPVANPASIGQQRSEPRRLSKPIKNCKVKWIDDMTLCNSGPQSHAGRVDKTEQICRRPYHGN